MSFYGSLLKKTNTIAFQQAVSRCLTYIHIVKRMKGIVLRYLNMKHKYKKRYSGSLFLDMGNKHAGFRALFFD